MGGIQYRVEGLENLDAQKQYIFMSNHESALDILLVFASLPYQLVFMSKKELKKIPFVGWAMILGKHIFVDRHNHAAALASMAEANQSLKQYPRSIMIFPEGTRSRDGIMKPFKKGGVILALETGMDIVPMAVLNTANVLQKGSYRVHTQSIELRIGKPIAISAFQYADRDRVNDLLYQKIVNLKS